MKLSHLLRGLAVAALLAGASQPASAQIFGDGPNVFCSLLSIGCPPPPPPPPPPPMVAEPPPVVKKVHKVRKVKVKPKAAVAAPKAADPQ